MPILDLFKRKRKDEYLPLESVPGAIPERGMGYPSQGMGMPGAGYEPLPGMPPQEFPTPTFPQPAAPMAGPPPEIQRMMQQIDALNYKLDTLKAVLDSINSRLANIESALKTSPGEKTGEGWTY